MKRVICKLAILLGLGGSPTVLSTLHATETLLDDHGISDERWFRSILQSVLPDDEVEEILMAERAEERRISRRVFEEKDRKISEIRKDYTQLIQKYASSGGVDESGIETSRALHDEWWEISQDILRILGEVNASIEEHVHKEFGFIPKSRWQDVWMLRSNLSNKFYQELSESIEQKLNSLGNQIGAFQRKLNQVELDQALDSWTRLGNLSQSKGLPLHPRRGWRQELKTLVEKEVFNILNQCYMEIKDVSPEMISFLVLCGYNRGDKFMVFSPRYAIEYLPLSPAQKSLYHYLMRVAEYRELKAFIRDFWNNPARIQLLLNPEQSHQIVQIFVQILQNLSEQTYWKDFVIYLHAVLEAPASRLQRLYQLATACRDGHYISHRNEVGLGVSEDTPCARQQGNYKEILGSLQESTTLMSTRGAINWPNKRINFHEISHLGDPLVYLQVLIQVLQMPSTDKTLRDIVANQQRINLNMPKFSFTVWNELSPQDKWNCFMAMLHPQKEWPRKDAAISHWHNPAEYYQIMGQREIELNNHRYFLGNPFCDNIGAIQTKLAIRDQYIEKDEEAFKISWQSGDGLCRYMSYWGDLQRLNREILEKAETTEES